MSGGAKQSAGEGRRTWAPRMWQGLDFPAWMRLLARNRFAVHPAYWYIAAIVSGVSLGHSALRYLQESLYGSRLDRVAVRQAPLFIVGHWRTGTTLLHELLMLDPDHACPTYAQCQEPHHFLLTERLLKRLWFLMPSHRPMDNMRIGWDQPQEDEFALALMGQPSPYLTIAFPNHPPQDQEAFDLDRLPRRAREAWKRAFVGFLRRVSYRYPGRRLVLKSPTHSCRIPTLLELFPEARFVHIVRDPLVVYPSTVHLWKSLYRTHGLQRPTFRGLEEHVVETFCHLYERLEEGKRLVPPGHWHELRYEDLTARPMEEMRRVYEGLNLGDFDRARPGLERYFADHAGYRPNEYPPLPPETVALLRRRWGPVIERYGYDQKKS
jgi:omega-hydroxy-beta-dihydromenaquinone-9 sulfotransferase